MTYMDVFGELIGNIIDEVCSDAAEDAGHDLEDAEVIRAKIMLGRKLLYALDKAIKADPLFNAIMFKPKPQDYCVEASRSSVEREKLAILSLLRRHAAVAEGKRPLAADLQEAISTIERLHREAQVTKPMSLRNKSSADAASESKAG